MSQFGCVLRRFGGFFSNFYVSMIINLQIETVETHVQATFKKHDSGNQPKEGTTWISFPLFILIQLSNLCITKNKTPYECRKASDFPKEAVLMTAWITFHNRPPARYLSKYLSSNLSKKSKKPENNSRQGFTCSGMVGSVDILK